MCKAHLACVICSYLGVLGHSPRKIKIESRDYNTATNNNEIATITTKLSISVVS